MADQEDVFKAGRFHPVKLPIETNGSSAAPKKPLLVYHPTENGDYPVVLLFHGWNIPNSCYTQLMEHITSHGYITIAPQMYHHTIRPDAMEEINDAVEVSNWLPHGLSYYLPDGVQPDFENVVISGHSRGGKVAFGLALGRTGKKTKVKLSALVGIDPVDGIPLPIPSLPLPFHLPTEFQTTPHILTKEPHSFNLDIPILVIGAGLGDKWNGISPPCAPDGINHKEFFAECSSPSYHFVAAEYGHMDFLDDDLIGKVGNIVCKSPGNWEPMRRFCGGLMVAFLNASLKHDSDALGLMDLFDNPSLAPVLLEQPQSYIVSKSLKFNSKL